MLRRIHSPERGASFLEYGSVIVLVAAMLGLLVTTVPTSIADHLETTLDGNFSSQASGPSSTGDASEDETGADGSGSEAVVEEGDFVEYGSAPELSTSLYDGSDVPVVNVATEDGGQGQDSGGGMWGWLTGNEPAFQFEDRGNYDWDCGWVLDGVCKLGGGAYQGAQEITDGLLTLGCHAHLCSNESFQATWGQTWDSAATIITQHPATTAGQMWEGLTEPFRENAANNTANGSFWKNAGYLLPGAIGGAMKPLGLIGKPPDSLPGAPDPEPRNPKLSPAEQRMERAERVISEDALNFDDPAEARQYGLDHWPRPIMPKTNIPDHERYSIVAYTTPTYKAINADLRGQPRPPGVENIPDSKVDSHIENIDNFLKRKPIPDNIVVTRSMDVHHIPGVSEPKDMIGEEFTEDAYMSTALGDSAFKKKNIELHLRVPEGTPGAYLEPYSTFPEERELLLERGLTYRIVDAVQDEKGRWQMYGEVVPE